MATANAATKTRDERFIDALKRLAEREDRGALAALRRGLGRAPGTATEMYPYVVPYLPTEGSLARDAPYFLVAALFAWHPHTWPGEPSATESNLGASFRRLADDTGSESMEARFVALLNAHPDDLSDHLRRVIALLKARDIPVNWRVLLYDLRFWDAADRRTQRAWARSFWRAEARATSADASLETHS